MSSHEPVSPLEIEIEAGNAPPSGPDHDVDVDVVDVGVGGEANRNSNVSLLTTTTTGGCGTPTKSAVTFAAYEQSPGGSSSVDPVDPITGSIETERTGHRKINRKDVGNIFRGSITTGTVSMEQVARIKRMHDKICDGVDWNFNYSCLLMIASIVAGLGLATDSSTTVISSMLLSPIMGPVIGMSYGLIIWDIPLIKRSARNEIISILVCIIFGLIIGISCHWTIMAEEWPTQEMLSRGTRTTFLCGFPIAFFSGLGVALSVLDDQTSSLVGVAISASLLPPAVNCGMLLIVASLKGEDWKDFSFDNEPAEPATPLGSYIQGEMISSLTNPPNFSQMGILSLMLTCANVIMVAAGATLMFRMKEVLPVTKKIFWEDLKIARRIYQGRAIDSVTGERFTVDELRNAYYAQYARESMGAPRESMGAQSNVSKHSEDQIASKHPENVMLS